MTCTHEGTQQIARLITWNRLGNETNDKITRRQFRQSVTKTFTHASLDAVAIHRAREQSLGNDHTQAGISHLIGPCHHHQIIRSSTLIVGEYPIEIGFVDKARFAEAHATRLVWIRVD